MAVCPEERRSSLLTICLEKNREKDIIKTKADSREADNW